MSLATQWKPNPKQEIFLSLPDSIFEALYGGAAGGGKSEVLLLLPIVRGFHNHPRFKGIIFRRTFPELKREIIERSHQWYPHLGGEFNSTEKQWQFPSRAIIRFGHMEYERDARKYDTDEYQYIGFDELTSFSEFQYTYLFSRCRTSDPSLPAIVRSGTNPGNIGHAWVRERFVEPIPGKITEPETIIIDSKSKLKRIFIQAKLTDNPHIDPEYVNKLGLLSLAEQKAKRDGDWYTFEGQVFSEYRDQRLLDEPENAVHVCKSFQIPDYWPRLLAIDWGYSALTFALWAALSPEGRLYIYREYSIRRALTSTWAIDIGKITGQEKIKDCVLCASAWQHRGEEELIHEEFSRLSGIKPRPADNSRIAGKLAIQEYIRWHPRPSRKVLSQSSYDHELAMRILRTEGTELYKNYLFQFEPELPETNLPRLQIFEDCTEFRRIIPLCVYEGNDSSGKVSEDVKEFEGDDSYDTGRYIIMAAEGLRQNHVEVERIKQVSQVVNNHNGDMTSFYRKMEWIERQSRGPINSPVRRQHRSRNVSTIR